MRITFEIFCLLSSSFAWLPPERCEQGETHRVRRTLTAAAVKTAGIEEPNIEKIAAKQHALLKETYKNHQFEGVPIRAECTPGPAGVYLYAPYNCTFHTYGPRLLSSVACQNTACKLTHTVSTVDTYTSAEGYNWGVKISTKTSFLDKTFEVGGEVSTGGTYTCNYTKGKTSTDTVECSESSGKGGHLQLYSVKSDMECDFGRITLEEEPRDHRHTVTSHKNYFTESELEEIGDSAAARFDPCREIIIDTNKISDRLFQKIMKEMPHFNPYTDMVMLEYPDAIMIRYFKKTKFLQEYKKIIPFTTEGGDSVFQYGCMLTSF